MRNYLDLEIYHLSLKLCYKVYNLTKEFPKEELYGLTSQIRRSAVSIGANIAEGCGRYGNKDFARFLQISIGSICELEFLLNLSFGLGYSNKDETLIKEIDVIKRKIIAFKKTL